MQGDLFAFQFGDLAFDTSAARWDTDKEHHQCVVIRCRVLVGADSCQRLVDKGLLTLELCAVPAVVTRSADRRRRYFGRVWRATGQGDADEYEYISSDSSAHGNLSFPRCAAATDDSTVWPVRTLKTWILAFGA